MVFRQLDVPDYGIMLAFTADEDADGLLSIDEVVAFLNDPVLAAAMDSYL